MVTHFVTSLAAIGKYHGAEDCWYLSAIPSQDCRLPMGWQISLPSTKIEMGALPSHTNLDVNLTISPPDTPRNVRAKHTVSFLVYFGRCK